MPGILEAVHSHTVASSHAHLAFVFSREVAVVWNGEVAIDLERHSHQRCLIRKHGHVSASVQ